MLIIQIPASTYDMVYFYVFYIASCYAPLLEKKCSFITQDFNVQLKCCPIKYVKGRIIFLSETTSPNNGENGMQ